MASTSSTKVAKRRTLLPPSYGCWGRSLSPPATSSPCADYVMSLSQVRPSVALHHGDAQADRRTELALVPVLVRRTFDFCRSRPTEGTHPLCHRAAMSMRSNVRTPTGSVAASAMRPFRQTFERTLSAAAPALLTSAIFMYPLVCAAVLEPVSSNAAALQRPRSFFKLRAVADLDTPSRSAGLNLTIRCRC